MKNTTNRRKVFCFLVFAMIAILATLFITPGNFSRVEGQTSFSVEYDTDRGGSDYKNFDISESNHEVCRNHCAADANCKAYTYTKPFQGRAAHCWLKNAVTNPVPYRSCCISGVKGAAFGGTAGMGAREDNTSLKGTTLSYYARPAFETCQADCVNNANCKGFTWIQSGTYNPNDPAMCYLMSAVTGRAPARGHYSGVKGASSGGGGGGSTGGIFAGTWDLYAWDVMTLEQNGNSVKGKYSGLGSGTLQGTVNAGKLYFSFRNAAGGVGEAVMSPIDANAGKYGLNYCDGRGCDPMKQGYVGAQKRR